MVIVGELIGIIADGAVPLIRAAALGDAVLPARTIVDLHAAHVGREVVLAFEAADTSRPIVMGVLRGKCGWPFDQRAGHLDVHGEGERLIVGASEQLVLQCGKSSLVMSKDGHIELTGETIVSEAAGPNRVRGGSVHLN
ncbi:DUF6484 domain-containing protein [Caballeronia sp. M1242]|uniref:DUF6484 domain-containing protein n=1 Tax=Caballeronia sp. M1242 TaxID=2814653 RepID=UPI0019D1F95A|nr:DUF6484 domain-containing protein [Caballeronia sp. M1242]QSN64236.1 hypothetical protein JYK05_23325 [Caballeronia sp. M1242]